MAAPSNRGSICRSQALNHKSDRMALCLAIHCPTVYSINIMVRLTSSKTNIAISLVIVVSSPCSCAVPVVDSVAGEEAYLVSVEAA